MLRPICVLIAAGLTLGACSGDAEKSPGMDAPAACAAACAAGEVCQGGECLPACSRAERCDDGEACRSGACHPIVCGDGVEEGDEECDNGDRNRDDASCTSACLSASCGDGVIWQGREQCDNGSDNADDGSCTDECREAGCGDGLVSANEACDLGGDNSDTGACTSRCEAARCGDGVVWSGHEECDDGNNDLNDMCPDGPNGTCRWYVPAGAASALGWQQGTHTNSSAPVATWTPSSSAEAAAQQLQLFQDASCGEASGGRRPLPGAASASLTVNLADEGSYSFKIITVDQEGNEVASACSPALIVDRTPPAAATDLGFAEASPHDRLTVRGTWLASSSADLAGQAVQLYGGGVCASTIGAPVDVGSASLEQFPIATPKSATYSFKIISRDQAGNVAASSCSPAMQTVGGQPYTATFHGVLPQNVYQVRIDPKNAATMYVTLFNGGIHKSTDSGATWTAQCHSSNIEGGANFGQIRVSPDGTAYAAGHTQFVRVEPLNGAECPVIISGSAAWASYFHSNRLAIDSTGKLYTWTFIGPGGLVASFDKGDSYDAINTTQSLFNSLEVDPHDDQHLVAVFNQHDTSPVGIHHSLNGGLNWTQTDATFEDYESGIRFNPAAEGWIYLGGGRYSKDGGLTWSQNAHFDCLEVDAAGAGYRLASSAGSTLLQRAADMTAPVWSTLHTFSGVNANLGVSMVSVVGGTIGVVLEGRLHVSTNAGASFNPIEFSVSDGTLRASSIVAHGSLVYAAAGGHIFKSTDGAANWAKVYAPTTPLDADTELHLNPGITAQLVARPESWNSTYESRLDVTLDGGASWSSTTDCCYGWSGVLALGAANASRVFYFGYEPRVSNDGGLSFADLDGSGQLVWDPWPAAFVSPTNANLAFYGEDAGRLYQHSLSAKTDTNITSRLPFADPAGMDLVAVDGVWQLRVVSRTGQIAVSVDEGASFTLVAGSGGLSSAERRIFVSHPDTPQLIATAPLLGEDVAYSPTLGASWVQANLDGCEIRSLALTDGELLIPCRGGAAMALAAP